MADLDAVTPAARPVSSHSGRRAPGNNAAPAVSEIPQRVKYVKGKLVPEFPDECEPHTPCPDGYVAWWAWADKMAETHTQRQCKGCGLWAIVVPKAFGKRERGSMTIQPGIDPHAATRERAAKIPKTPSGIRAVLAANADPEVLAEFDEHLDLAYSECLPGHTSEPLERLISFWWLKAVLWSDPVSYRATLELAARYLRDGIPAAERDSRDPEFEAALAATRARISAGKRP